MDIFAHGLYSGALGKITGKNKSNSKQIFWWSVLFGMMPDFVAFAPSFIISMFSISSGHHALVGGINLSQILYPYTHSLVIAVAVFLIVWLLKKAWALPLLGWVFHILLDILLHAPDFFPTPFLFPVSSWTSPIGISWGNTYILIGTWVLIIAYYVWTFVFKGDKQKS